MSGRIQTLATATARTLAISFPRVLDQLLGRTSMDACDRRLKSWSRALLDDVGIRIEAQGFEHLSPRSPRRTDRWAGAPIRGIARPDDAKRPDRARDAGRRGARARSAAPGRGGSSPTPRACATRSSRSARGANLTLVVAYALLQPFGGG